MTLVPHCEQVIDDKHQHPHVLVIAAWREHAGFRARITFSDLEAEPTRTSMGVDGGDRVVEVVTEWLRRIGAEVRNPGC